MPEANEAPIRGRLAPTPSGRLHWGNLRSSLLAWLQIRLQKGTMVLRIEDVDRGRARDHLRDAILKDLAWLGLDWDEGPDVGGPFGPYLQSQRDELYEQALERLEIYPCVCTRAQLKAKHKAGEGPACARCRNLADRGIQSDAAWRWRLPADAPDWVDRGYGEFKGGHWPRGDDPILKGRDGFFRYILAVVVDDHEMRIDEVCRGADLLEDTPRQIQLAQALYGRAPRFFHLPLVLGPDGKKLSKSEGAPDLQSLRSAGTAPSRVIAALAQSCALIPPNRDQITPRQLLAEIDLERLYQVSNQPDRQSSEIP